MTVLLTTQYLEEADELAHQIVVVDHGRVIADGTPQSLKEASKGAHLEVMLSAPHPDAVRTLAPLVSGEVSVSDDGRRLSAGVESSTGLATVVVRALDVAGVLVDNIEVRQPSLDDVFFSLTGEHVDEGDVTSSSDGEEGEATGGLGFVWRGWRPDGKRAGRSERLMSTTTLTPTTSVGVSSPRSNRLLGPLADIWAMTRRNLVHISREPMQLSDVTIQPVLFTFLFVFIFGGAIALPGGGSYKDYLLAGILALNLVTSVMGTGVGMATDLHEGMIDRFRALPMWRPAVLIGRSAADFMTSCLCALIVGLTGLVVGWRS